MSDKQKLPASIAPAAGQTSDTRLLERAIRQRWPIKPEIREAVVARLGKIIETKNASKREVTAAARALIMADRLNQQDEHQAEGKHVHHEHEHVIIPPDERRARLAAFTERLRAGTVVDGVATESADRSAGGDGSTAGEPDQPGEVTGTAEAGPVQPGPVRDSGESRPVVDDEAPPVPQQPSDHRSNGHSSKWIWGDLDEL